MIAAGTSRPSEVIAETSAALIVPTFDIASLMFVSPGSVTQVLATLQARGLIRRVADSDDRRRRLATLTPKGRRRFAKLFPKLLVAQRHLLDGLPAAGRRPSTITGYRHLLEHNVIAVLGAIELQALTATDLDRLYAAMLGRGLAMSTVRKTHVIIGKALSDAERKGIELSEFVNDLPRREIEIIETVK